MLKALAKEEAVTQPYHKNFLATHKLGSHATVKRSLLALLQKELVYKNLAAETPHYIVYDKFLLRWLQLLP